MAAFESSNSNIGHRLLRFRAGPTDDCEDPRSPSRRNEFGGKRRRQISGVRRQDVPDNTRGILDRERDKRSRF